MAKTEFPEAIKSRPVYGELEPRKGKAHLLIADSEGAQAILDLAKICTRRLYAECTYNLHSKGRW